MRRHPRPWWYMTSLTRADRPTASHSGSRERGLSHAPVPPFGGPSGPLQRAPRGLTSTLLASDLRPCPAAGSGLAEQEGAMQETVTHGS